MSSEVGDSHDSMGEAAGVAEDDAVTASKRVQRQICPVHKSALTEQRLKSWMTSQAIHGELVGNIGCMFGNWGSLPENSSECERVLMQLNKQPAHILCLAEAEEIVEAALRSAPREDASEDNDTSSAVADELATRNSFEYLVIRGNERSSILMAVRANVASSLRVLAVGASAGRSRQ